MKFREIKEQGKSVFPSILVGAAVIVMYFIALKFGKIWATIKDFMSILSPVFIGFVIAFLLNRPINFFENNLFNRLKFKKKKTSRAFAITLSYLIALILVIGLIWIIVPQIISSITQLVDNLDTYLKEFQKIVQKLLDKYHIDIDISKEILERIGGLLRQFNNLGPTLQTFYDIATGVGATIINVGIGIVFGVYFNFSKELFIAQINKTLLAFFSKRTVASLKKVANITCESFDGFVNGRLLTCMILGIMNFVFMMLLKMPYPVLISVIVAITDIIPVFGPIIGAVPSALIILIVSPIKCLWFIILTVILQQIEGNILAPRILGESMGLSSFWVMFAIVLGGGLGGVFGMIVSVPICAVFYTLLKNFIENRLAKKQLSMNSGNYNKNKGAEK